VIGCLFLGNGTQTGVEIGAGCTDTGLTGNAYSNLSPSVSDAGASTIRLESVVSFDKSSANAYMQFNNAGTNLAKLETDGSTSLRWVHQVANGKFRFKLAGTSSSDEFTVFDSADAQVLRAFGNGDVVQSKSAASMFIKGALDHDGSKVGFFNTTPVTKPTVTGSRDGNAALQSLLTALASLGLITDSSS